MRHTQGWQVTPCKDRPSEMSNGSYSTLEAPFCPYTADEAAVIALLFVLHLKGGK